MHAGERPTAAVALTFDDGPDPVWTPLVLDALAGASATFFVVAPLADRYPSLPARMREEGHEVAFHCTRHARHDDSTREEIEADVEQGLLKLGGPVRYWRTPWGVVTPVTGRVAREHTLTLVGWTADTQDWRGGPHEQMLARVEGEVLRESIVLMHDGVGPGARRNGCAETVALVRPLVCGFIGCEAAASLSLRGAEVVLISLEQSPQGERLGDEVGERIEGWLREYAVDLRLGARIEGLERTDAGYALSLEDGDTVDTQTVLFGTGVAPRIGLADAAGLEVDGGVVTDSSMRTSAPGIFAVGDIARAYNESAGRHLSVEHWGDALEHGRVAGTVLAGSEAAWSMAPGFWSTIGDKTLKYWAWGDGWDEQLFEDKGGPSRSGTAKKASSSGCSLTVRTRITERAAAGSNAESLSLDDALASGTGSRAPPSP